jgi:hypothetical protein
MCTSLHKLLSIQPLQRPMPFLPALVDPCPGQLLHVNDLPSLEPGHLHPVHLSLLLGHFDCQLPPDKHPKLHIGE